jgi:hypothetical protein
VPRRTRWRGKGHEFMGREGRTPVRKPQAGQRNFGEPFRLGGGGLRRAKALANLNRGRGDTGTYSGELDRAESVGHRASTADRRDRAPARQNWPNTGRNRENWARGRVSHLGAELGEAWSGLWRAGWPGTRARVSGGEDRARERARVCEMRRGRARGTGGALRRELGAWAGVVAEKSGDVRECARAGPR